MSQTTTASIESPQLLMSAKKYVVTTIISSVLTGAIILIGFYFNTKNTDKIQTENIVKLTEAVETIQQKEELPVIKSELHEQKLQDIQRQILELKTTVEKTEAKVTTLDEKMGTKFDKMGDKFDKIYEKIMRH